MSIYFYYNRISMGGKPEGFIQESAHELEEKDGFKFIGSGQDLGEALAYAKETKFFESLDAIGQLESFNKAVANDYE